MSIIINGAGTITGVSATGITTAPTNATDATKLPLAGGTVIGNVIHTCLLYTSPSPRDRTRSRMPSSA